MKRNRNFHSRNERYIQVRYLLTVLALLFAQCLFAQKRPIDLTTVDEWLSFRDTDGYAGRLSNNGKFCVWSYAQFERGRSWTVLSDLQTGRRWEFNGNKGLFSEDSRYFMTASGGDSLALINLEAKRIEYLPDVRSFSLAENERSICLLLKSGKDEKLFRIKDLSTNRENRYEGVEQYWVNRQGNFVVVKNKDGLLLINLRDGAERKVAEPGAISMLSFSGKGDAFCYLSGAQEAQVLKYTTVAAFEPKEVCSDGSVGFPDNMRIGNPWSLKFTEDDSGIFFSLQYKNIAHEASSDILSKAVNIWSYRDTILQPAQREPVNSFTAVVFPATKRILQLEDDYFRIESELANKGRYIILSSIVSDAEFYWNKQKRKSVMVDMMTGQRKELCALGYPIHTLSFSPTGRFITWFDQQQKNYCCYEMSSGQTRIISQLVDEPLILSRRGEADKLRDKSAYGIATWLKNDEAVLVYSCDDIWQLDPLGNKRPINITNGYGKANDIRFRLLKTEDNEPMALNGSWLTFAFNRKTKQNGFWTIRPGAPANPEKRIMDDHAWFIYPTAPIVPENNGVDVTSCKPVKAKKAQRFLVRRMSSTEPPNLFSTSDFRSFQQVSQLSVPAGYNMVKAELVTWTLPDGLPVEGILHKPQDFDPTKKYPVIFNYYERRSECLNAFRVPKLAGHNINIPWFVSRGYLVFEPDFYYKTGKTYQCIVDAVNTAAKKLASYPFVDTSRMGAQGQSFGGYATNVIATGTTIFKAACEMAGPTDIISEYGSIRPGGHNNQTSADVGQRNLAVFPWERPEVFIENSPVFHVGRMTTPLLICHNRDDGAILFPQAVELYLAMRRAGKTGWMLEYDNEGHDLCERPNQLDFTIRMEQFFDHYLKGKPAPAWMTQGIPAKLKGIRTGFQTDAAGRCSNSCTICNGHAQQFTNGTNNSN